MFYRILYEIRRCIASQFETKVIFTSVVPVISKSNYMKVIVFLQFTQH